MSKPLKSKKTRKRLRTVHVCAACKAEFEKKSECWWHMDNACSILQEKKRFGLHSSKMSSFETLNSSAAR